VCLVANGPEQKAPENLETDLLDITHDEKRQEKHRIHQFFSSLLGSRTAAPTRSARRMELDGAEMLGALP
jgi:hypothetical protein